LAYQANQSPSRESKKASDVTSGFRREDENCALMGYYFSEKGQFLTDVSGQPVGHIFKGQESKKKSEGF